MKLTALEKEVIEAYVDDDFVRDFGYEHPNSSTWVKSFHQNLNMSREKLSGVISSLVKKGLVYTNGESFSLTSKGIKMAREVE